MAQTVKNAPAMQVSQVQSLGWEDLLEKGMAAHFSNLAWRIPWTEKPGGLQSMGLQRVRLNRATNGFTFTFKNVQGGLPWWSSGEDSALPMGVGWGWRWAGSLVRELRFQMPRGQKKKKDNAVALSIVMTLCTHHTISRVCSSSQGESLYPLNSLLFFVLFCLFCFFFFLLGAF